MNHSGTISSNETWSPGDNPHIITGNISIDSSAIVTVEAGVEIYFDGYYYITAGSGSKFNVEGSEENKVLITSNATSPTKGDWSYLQDLGGDSHLRHAIIEYAQDVPWTGNIRYFGEVTNCLLRHMGRLCIRVYNNNNQTIENNEFDDVRISIHAGGYVTFNHTLSIKYNLIHDCNGNGIEISNWAVDGQIDIINNTIVGIGGSTGINLYNVDTNTGGIVYIYNNIIDNWWKGIAEAYSECTIDNDYNNFYNNSIDIDGLIIGTHSITSDPEFLSGTNYEIDNGSPCATSGYGTPYEQYIGYFEPTIPEYLGEDTLTISDEIELNLSLEKIELEDTLNLSDDLQFGAEYQESDDSTSLSDEISFSIEKSNKDILTLSDEIDVIVYPELEDTLNLSDEITVATIELDLNDIYNQFHMLKEVTINVNNKINTLGLNLSDITNDVRFLKSWQVPGEAGYQSLGKTYVKVYINSIEQTDIDVDSITISKALNSSHTANFILGRAYDSNSKPNIESSVEIKYHIWTLYKGYITQINPTGSPDSIKISCKDEYWIQNRTNKYFFVGHRPQDNHELYYDTVSQGLSACGVSFGIGDFIPETMNLFGTGISDCISQLVENSGNYSWFYHVNKVNGAVSKKLWVSGSGSQVDLEKQKIGTNLGLYQVLNHQIDESIDDLINKFRVSMGDTVIRRFNNTGGFKEYSGYRYVHLWGSATPDWSSTYERLAKDSSDGNGVFYHPTNQNENYQDVFTKYDLPPKVEDLEDWTDRYPPQVHVTIPFGFWSLQGQGGRLTEGFTIDYEEGKLIFSEPIFLYRLDENGEISEIRAPNIHLQLWKKQYYSETDNPSDNPENPEDITSPLIFITEKMGSYVTTILKPLELSQFSIQIGGWYQSGETEEGRTIYSYIPSWNDTSFAQDYANWKLSQICDKQYTGSIELTIDAMCFYDIDLSKRIMVDGILENSLNIQSITYDIGSWKASVTLKTGRQYQRTISLPSHGQ